MRKLFTIILAVLLTARMLAQTPEKMSYQAVIRNSSNALVTNTIVGIKISILQGSETSTAVYTETQTTTTNANGLVSIEIGGGAGFSSIDWAAGPYFIKTETDPTGGNAYSITGTSQLLSVPYALHAKTAETVQSGIAETDPVYSLSVASGITVTDTINWNSAIQNLSTLGNTISISNGNTITMPDGLTNVPIYTTVEVELDTRGLREKLYQIYENGAWWSFRSNCWPEPTTANAGTDQTFTDGTTTTTLAANTPVIEHGAGLWTIVSGTGGSFTDATNPKTTFSGTECKTYSLKWTISTSCNSSSNNVNITFNQTPTTSNAGSDQILTDGTTTATLAANNPETEHGTGLWTILSGTGGSFTDATSPISTFTGNLHETYTLQWTITTNCSSSADEVVIAFWQDGAGSVLTDINGNTYNTVYIGGQLWMAGNLRTTKYNDNTPIPTGHTDGQWAALNTGAYAVYPHATIDGLNSDAEVLQAYGALYNWYALETGNLCPTGWHLPSDAEWSELTNYLGGESVAGGKLKEISTTHWFNPNTDATNETGFTALPGGGRFYDGTFGAISIDGYWWSATESNASNAWCRNMNYHHSNVFRNDRSKSLGFSVRCVRD